MADKVTVAPVIGKFYNKHAPFLYETQQCLWSFRKPIYLCDKLHFDAVMDVFWGVIDITQIQSRSIHVHWERHHYDSNSHLHRD
ncbi:hypothetical protein SLS57_010759 [Botryosphaeria dothidea]